MVFTSGIVEAELPGLPPPVVTPAAPEAPIRPTEKPANVVVQSTGTVRGNLYKLAAQTPVPVGADGQQIGRSLVDFTAAGPARPRKFQKNDLVTIIVAENSATSSDSENKNEKKQDFDLALQQFLQLSHSASGVPTVGVVGQPSKLPEIKFHYDNNKDFTASHQRSDTFTDRFSAVVVDIKPNGTMVIEAVRQITVDRNVQEYRMSGICRIQDVTGDNTVLSTQLANLNLSKKTKGDVHDGVKNGWLNKLIDKFNLL
ncbi:MAG: flagellar basal body L-ring protein FlgH [Phycisphaerales bacterium]|nr:flagellar basal body L-ring protein FlgH [Phycisphaerales bacterium]